MTSVTQLITQEIYNKANQRLKALNKVSRAGIRLQAIISAKEHGVGITANVFGVSENTLRTWVKSFAKEDVEGLDYKPGRGRPSVLFDKYSKIITKLTKDNCNITLNQIARKLLEDHDIVTSKSAVHRVLHKLGLSYITPRPVHYKQKTETQAEFKKKSS